MLKPAFSRNVLILSACQGLAMTASTTMFTVSALTGEALASDRALATLPLGLQFVATMLTTIPASHLMGRIGRRAGFSIGAGLGMAAGSLALTAAAMGSFWLFCLGNALVGVAQGFALFLRFTAVEVTVAGQRERAISYVLAGGIVAALIGPELAKLTRDWIPAAPFGGCFAGIVTLFLLQALLLQGLRVPPPSGPVNRRAGRRLGVIARQGVFIVAALSCMVGYSVMSLLMTATPLAMTGHHHAFGDTAMVIQAHVLAMFLPSFFTGDLIRRFGLLNVLLFGALMLALAVGIGLSGTGVWQFWWAMVAVGLGWNFLYIGGTALLTQAYRIEETAKAQALNDFLMFGLVATASFSSGALQARVGWEAVNYAAIGPVLVVMAAVLWLKLRRVAVPA
jgi:MFS family permease